MQNIVNNNDATSSDNNEDVTSLNSGDHVDTPNVDDDVDANSSSSINEKDGSETKDVGVRTYSTGLPPLSPQRASSLPVWNVSNEQSQRSPQPPTKPSSYVAPHSSSRYARGVGVSRRQAQNSSNRSLRNRSNNNTSRAASWKQNYDSHQIVNSNSSGARLRRSLAMAHGGGGINYGSLVGESGRRFGSHKPHHSQRRSTTMQQSSRGYTSRRSGYGSTKTNYGGLTQLSLRDSIALEVRKSVTYEVKKEMQLLQESMNTEQNKSFRHPPHSSSNSSRPNITHDISMDSSCNDGSLLFYDVDDDYYVSDVHDGTNNVSSRSTDGNRVDMADGPRSSCITHEQHLLKLLTRIFRYKLVFAMTFGFINAITFLQSRSYATMMTGNLLRLTNQLMQALTNDYEQSGSIQLFDGQALFTFVLIICYELGVAFFYVVWFGRNHYYIPIMLLKLVQEQVQEISKTFASKPKSDVEEEAHVHMKQQRHEKRTTAAESPPKGRKNGGSNQCIEFLKDHVVVVIVMFVAISMGIASDTLQKFMGCHGGGKCTGSIEDKFYLLPIAIITGMVSGGYLTSHPTGVTTNMVTGHFGKTAQMIIKLSVNCIIHKAQTKIMSKEHQLYGSDDFNLESEDDYGARDDDDDDDSDIEAKNSRNNKKKDDKSDSITGLHRRNRQKGQSSHLLCCGCYDKNDENADAEWDTLKQSLGIIIFFFLGALFGFFMPKRMMSIHDNVPIFTLFGTLLATLVGLFDMTYRESINYVVLVEQEGICNGTADASIEDRDDEGRMDIEHNNASDPQNDRYNNLLKRLEEDVEHEDLGD